MKLAEAEHCSEPKVESHMSAPLPQIEGSTRAFPKTKEQYVNWGDEDFMDGSRGSRCAHAMGAWCSRR